MRLAAGIGYLHASDSALGVDRTISGTGLGVSFAFGGALTRNLVLFGELASLSASDPTVEIDGSSSTADSATLNLTALGPGVAYYLEPLNLYFSGALSFSRVSGREDDSDDSFDLTDMGVGGNVLVGKEWWVSANWGLGVAGMLHLASRKVNGDASRMTALGLALLFSATYN